MEKAAGQFINKAYKAFWTCRGTFGKSWGLKPKVIYWIYTGVVRIIVTYAATIWWSRVKLKASQAELSKLQRIACLGITGAMRTATTAAIEVRHEPPPPTAPASRCRGKDRKLPITLQRAIETQI
jgi:hypothetical protein